MGRRASPSPSGGRRTRGAAFQRSGGGGLTEGDSETPSRETPKEGARDVEAQRPGEGEQGDPGRRNRKTWGEGTRRPEEREHGNLGKGNTETWG